MRADAPVYVLAQSKDNTIRWIDPSFINMMRETGISVDKKLVLALTRVGMDFELEINGEKCYIRRYNLQSGDKSFFEAKQTEKSA